MQLVRLFGLVYVGSRAYAGFTGLGVDDYNPLCCYACRNSISSARLSCSTDQDAGPHSHGAPLTLPNCRAEDVPFLTTLAYCIKTKCEVSNLPDWVLELYWAEQATGDPTVPPKWGYAATLQQITVAPNQTFASGTTLNYTALVNATAYATQERFYNVREDMANDMNQYS
jgi:hypothetical protein